MEAENVKEATEAGRQQVNLTIPHTPGDLIQVLRVQQHSETFSNGEVDGLAEFGADFSQDRLYRYGLYRIWDKSLPPAMVIGLNPSTADERLNDPTVRRCLRFAKDLGYGGLFYDQRFCVSRHQPQDAPNHR